jgi:hyperosmotically inducible periplasmic protein
MNVRSVLRLSGTSLVALAILSAPAFGHSRNQEPAPDNTKTNRDLRTPTADQQKMNAADRAITQKIRKAIHEDKSLSTYAHNIKIVTRAGKVTLSGPVRSEEEKSAVVGKAAEIAGVDNVTNELKVVPRK